MDREYAGYRFYIERIQDNLDETMAMWRAHWDEQGEEGLRDVAFNPDVEQFVRLERNRLFLYITVRQGETLAGHFGLLFHTNRQTSQRTAGDDFYYLWPEHRRGMLAIKLIKFARDLAFDLGAAEFSVSHRVTVRDQEPMLRRCGMKRIAHVFSIRR